MRNIILLIFIVCNTIAIIYTMAHPLTINFFSLKVMFVALSLVLTILFILLKTNRFSLILSLISLVLVFIHIAFIAHSTYTYLFN